jgi:hypothetical protein
MCKPSIPTVAAKNQHLGGAAAQAGFDEEPSPTSDGDVIEGRRIPLADIYSAL